MFYADWGILSSCYDGNFRVDMLISDVAYYEDNQIKDRITIAEAIKPKEKKKERINLTTRAQTKA